MSKPEDYWVGWICAISTEAVAATLFLDEEHPPLAATAKNDNNTYQLGRIGPHNVVIAVLPEGEYGTVSASVVARDMLRTFENIRVGLMVGIGGGAPTRKDDIRLGDIVVSSPGNGYSGVFQYDYGKAIQNREFETTAQQDQPPMVVRTAVQGLKTAHKIHGHRFNKTIEGILKECRRKVREEFSRPVAEDRLYKPEYVHRANPEDQARCVDVCGEDSTTLVQRRDRDEDDDNPAIHHGLIASANTLMKDAEIRDYLSERHRVLCFEMEAAGLMNHFPCLVIRGICDYSDTHKNKEWQGFAAMTAAAYAKDLLLKISPNNIENERRLKDLIEPLKNDIRDTRREIQEVSSSLRTADAERKVGELYTWLSPAIASENHERALSMRQEGSGLWFIHSREFQEWKSTQQSFLWLHGIPGCGKTVLCSSAIDDVQRSESDSTSVLYFYFDFSNHRKTSPEDMIKSLMNQAYHQQVNTRKPLDELWERCRPGSAEGPRQPTFEDLCSTFRKMLELIGGAYILLDAIDECREESRPNLLSWLENIRELPINLLVTSRAEHDISSALHGSRHPGQVVDIRNTLVTEDIRAYIRWRINPGSKREREDERCIKNEHKNFPTAHGFEIWRGNTAVQDEIETKLMEKANGMFRWVKCQLDILERCLHYPALRMALNSLPRDLHDTYARILDNLDDLKRPWTIRILQFLAYSERPLTLEEMVDALAVDPDAEEQDLSKNRMPFPNEIVGYASTLVTLVVRQTEEGTVKELQLAHFSVKEYLTSEKALERQFQEAHAKADMTNICLSYLLHLKKPMPVKDLRKTFPFAQFCARYWLKYAAVAETRDETAEKIQKLAIKFFTCKESSFTNCYRLYDPDHSQEYESNDDQKEPAHALYYTSLGGLPISTKTLLDKKADVNEQGGHHGNALQAASCHGHLEIVQQLLDAGADVNATGGSSGTALQAATSYGYKEVVKLLLDRGADINVTGGTSGSALRLASCIEDQEILKLLLDHEANVNRRMEHLGHALNSASLRGHTDVVKLLIDRMGNHNARGRYLDDALSTASVLCRTGVVELLLENGANANAREGHAFFTALKSGYKKIVKMLLDRVADANEREGGFDKLLHTALRRGYTEAVELILDRGADINARLKKNSDSGTLCTTPLLAAVSCGHEDVVELLVAKGVDICFHPQGEDNALCMAAQLGHANIVKILLRHKADSKIPEGWYGSALEAAICNKHSNVAKVLFKEGISLDKQEDRNRLSNPRQSAVPRAYANAVHMLVENSVSPDNDGIHQREDILNSINMGFETVCNGERIAIERAGTEWDPEPFNSFPPGQNEEIRKTLIACVDGNHGQD